MTDQDYEVICRLLRERSAIVLEPGKQYLVEARLAPLVRKLNLASISALVATLRSPRDNGLPRQIVEAMVTTESSFFRDHLPFEALRRNVLPELIGRRRAERCLRIWCAACSHGQEPYSIALLLREHFPELSSWRISILATDISAEALARAKLGHFSQIEANRGLPATLLVKYFQQHGTDWHLKPTICQMVDFRQMNLADPWPAMPRMDLVLLRNVMIYFEVETKKSILARLTRVLHPHGYLLLGSAETTLNLHDSYHRIEALKAGFYQLNNAAPS
jgi:chemotaxis protein methyltransferase CheR